MEGSYHHGALRQALLDSALAILDEGDELSLRAVARRAGVSHAAPYHHFADRRALIAAVAEEGLATLRARMVAAVARHPVEPAMQLLEVGVAYVGFALENRPLFRLVFSAELADREGLPGLQAAYGSAFEVLTELIGPLIGAPAEGEEVRYAALHSWSVVHGLANLLLENQLAGVRTMDDARELVRRVLLREVPSRPNTA